jgi:nitrite reductase/ring-hydroxylating ferredoxin subunit
MTPTMQVKDKSTTPPLLRLCALADVDEDLPLQVNLPGRPPLAVYQCDGEVYVSDDTCSHGEASLSEGTLQDGRIECPWHTGSFCLKTGAALSFPAVTPIRVYPAIVRDGTVFIAIEDTSP